MADLFSTNTMLAVINSLLAPSQFLLNRYFPGAVYEQTEEVHFDMLDKTRRLAPFVSPVVAGKIVQSQGMTTMTFKPAYIKDMRVFDVNRPFVRSAGEPIGGDLDPMTRRQILLASELTDQIDMTNRRLEVMAADALRNGSVTVTGELYPTTNVNFNRDVNQRITLAGPTRWNQTGVKPLNDLQQWSLIVKKRCGAKPIDVVMTVDVWEVFRENPQVLQRIEKFNLSSPMVQDAQMSEGGDFMGNIDGYNIYVYSGWYLDDTGVEQPILPDGTVLMLGPQLEGIRVFGAIRDEEAGFAAVPYYPKSWIEKNPSVRYLLMQSAPLVVPRRINASFSATVF